MSRLSSKEAFTLRCVLSMLVEMIKQDTRLSLWICSPLHYSVLHFYVTSSSLIMVNLSEWIKAEGYKQKPEFFSCLCYQAANISQKPSVYFAFVTIPVLKKNVHKRAVCWLAVTGRRQRAEWRDSEGRETEFGLESWKMLFPIQCFLHASLPMVVSGLFTESTHKHVCLTCCSVP